MAATNDEKVSALAKQRIEAARDGRNGVPNPSGETLVFDPKAPGNWRKATTAEHAAHEADLDELVVAMRADQAKGKPPVAETT